MRKKVVLNPKTVRLPFINYDDNKYSKYDKNDKNGNFDSGYYRFIRIIIKYNFLKMM